MKRVLTALVAIPAVVLITIFSPDWIFAFVVGLVAALALEELLSLADKKGLGRAGRWFLVPAAVVTISFLGGANWVMTSLVAATLVLMTASVFSRPLDTALTRVGLGLGGLVYCCVTLGFLILMARDAILLLLAIIWVGDSAAYYGGRALGRHLLAPHVSPKKTVEGAIAGLIGSVVAGTIGGVWFLREPALSLMLASAATA